MREEEEATLSFQNQLFFFFFKPPCHARFSQERVESGDRNLPHIDLPERRKNNKRRLKNAFFSSPL